MSRYPLADTATRPSHRTARDVDLCAWIDEARAQRRLSGRGVVQGGGGAAVWFSPDNVRQRLVRPRHGPPRRAGGDRGARRVLRRARRAGQDGCLSARGPHRCCGGSPRPASWPPTSRRCSTSRCPRRLRAGRPADVGGAHCADTDEERALWAEPRGTGLHRGPCHRRRPRARPGDLAARPRRSRSSATSTASPPAPGCSTLVDGVAMFNGDSTLPAARGRGRPERDTRRAAALRLRRGCDLARDRGERRAGRRSATSCAPDSASRTRACALELPSRRDEHPCVASAILPIVSTLAEEVTHVRSSHDRVRRHRRDGRGDGRSPAGRRATRSSSSTAPARRPQPLLDAGRGGRESPGEAAAQRRHHHHDGRLPADVEQIYLGRAASSNAAPRRRGADRHDHLLAGARRADRARPRPRAGSRRSTRRSPAATSARATRR